MADQTPAQDQESNQLRMRVRAEDDLYEQMRQAQAIVDRANQAQADEIAAGGPQPAQAQAPVEEPQAAPQAAQQPSPETQAQAQAIQAGAETPRPMTEYPQAPDSLYEQMRQAELLAQRDAEAVPQPDQGTSEAIAGGARDVLRGVNNQFAQILGVPTGIADQVLERVTGSGFRKPSEGPVQVVQRAMAQMGLDTEVSGKRMERYGAEGLNAILGTMVMRQIAGPAMRATAPAPGQLPTGFNNTITQVGQDLINNPGKNIAGAIGSAPGSVEGRDFGTQVAGPVGGEIGAMVGGTATGAAFQGVATRAIKDQYLANSGPNASYPTQQQGYATPMLPDARPERMGAYAETAVRGAQQAIDTRIQDVVSQLSSRRWTPAQMAQGVRNTLDRLVDNAEALERHAYERLGNNQIIPLSDNVSQAAAIIDRSHGFGVPFTPDNIINNLFERLTSGHGQRIQTPNGAQLGLPAEDVRRFRSAINYMRRQAQGSQVGGIPRNEQMLRNLSILDDALLQSMDQHYGSNPQYQQAREISRMKHERLYDSPVGELLVMNSRGVDRVNAQDTLRQMLANPQGLEALSAALTDWAPQAGYNGAMLGSIAQYNSRARTMRLQVEQSLSREFQDQIDGAVEAAQARAVGTNRNPGQVQSEAAKIAASSLARKWTPLAQAWTQTVGRTQQAVQQIQRLMIQRNDLEQSVLARAMKQDPKTFVNGLIASRDPVTEITNAMRGIRLSGQANRRLGMNADPDRILPQDIPHATQALKNEVVGAFMGQNTGRSPTALLEMLQGANSKWRDILGATLDSSELQRLTRMLEAGVKMENGEWYSTSENATRYIGGLFTKLGALATGRLVAHVASSGSYGSLAIPAGFARSAKSWYEGLFNDIDDPIGWISRAVTNPEIERQLMERVPGGLRDAQEQYKQLRNITIKMSVETGKMLDNLTGGGNRGVGYTSNAEALPREMAKELDQDSSGVQPPEVRPSSGPRPRRSAVPDVTRGSLP